MSPCFEVRTSAKLFFHRTESIIKAGSRWYGRYDNPNLLPSDYSFVATQPSIRLALAVQAGFYRSWLCLVSNYLIGAMQGRKAALVEPSMPALQRLPLLLLGRRMNVGHVQGFQRMV